MPRIERFFENGILIKEITTDGDESLPGSVDLAPGLASLSLIKAVEESQFTLGVAYPVNKLDVKQARDGRRDFASHEVVERAAWDWMLKSQDIGLFHENGTSGHGTVVESSVYRGPDWLVKSADGTEQTIVAGDWLMGTLWDDPAWSLVKSLYVRGYSPQGRARRGAGPVDPHKLAALRN